MEREEIVQSDTIELGAASVETRGHYAGIGDDLGGSPVPGLTID
jgi:hypothetical protein